MSVAEEDTGQWSVRSPEAFTSDLGDDQSRYLYMYSSVNIISRIGLPRSFPVAFLAVFGSEYIFRMGLLCLTKQLL